MRHALTAWWAISLPRRQADSCIACRNGRDAWLGDPGRPAAGLSSFCHTLCIESGRFQYCADGNGQDQNTPSQCISRHRPYPRRRGASRIRRWRNGHGYPHRHLPACGNPVATHRARPPAMPRVGAGDGFRLAPDVGASAYGGVFRRQRGGGVPPAAARHRARTDSYHAHSHQARSTGTAARANSASRLIE